MAEHAERSRVAATENATAALAWQAAAADAAAFGRSLVDGEDRIHRPVGEAIIAAGGTAEVAKEKDYHVIAAGGS